MSMIETAQINALTRLLDAASARHRVITTNIANIDTPDYSRQRAELVEGDAYFNGSHMVGTGVELEQIASLRDRVLELRIQDEKQQQGSLEAQVHALQDIETLFSADTANIGDAINQFFNSISELSTDASSLPLRERVLTSATNLASRFRTSAAMLAQRQFSLDLDIQQSVEQVNQLTAQIAELNGKIATSAHPTEMGSFEDRRNLLLQNLSSLIGNQVFVADDGLTVTTSGGTALVLGNQSFALDCAREADGTLRINSGSQEITGEAYGGKLGGLLTIRGEVIPGLLSNLDTLAGNIAGSVNAVHRGGFDLDGNPGLDLFVPPPAGNAGAAASFAVQLTNSRQLAGSIDGTAGGNANLNTLLELRDQNFVDGNPPINFYAKLTFQLGSTLASANSELNASELVSEQLAEQRGAVSSVSLDEEAANLIRYQRAFEAAARVLSVLSDLTEISVNLGKN